MLRALILWKVTRNTYITALTLAFILLMVQIFKIGFILFGLPLTSSVPFFLVWFVYYGFFFIPDGLITAVATAVYELKEKRLLHVLYSFHISPLQLLGYFALPVLFFLVLSGVFSQVLYEEHVSFARRGLLIQYKDRLFENMPEKTFLSSGDVVVYAGKKDGRELRDVFLKYKDTHILADRAVYEGRGRFLFERGSLLTRERGKYFLMEFRRYWLDTEEFLTAEIREKRVRRGKILNAANTLSIIPAFLFVFVGVLKFCRSHTQVYYLIALTIVLHQLFLFGVKVSL
ncbi:LptF/LptG family permease [Hydrogenivirga sp. 128-5-R1-1]|uniref:LptF/LptG family permease n=1 Tax=Hydrogenivirga sp. 128-5-R1-1 TaxID=392423 RepID=UPI00015EF87B|nr:LptF/LptG family permease [Hydrogenivirga sp. 128-5-R1-1]EDP75640.1 hypothetical protein HG1285_16790 [Hydrogenivirga sp. 128-5-R1-1]